MSVPAAKASAAAASTMLEVHMTSRRASCSILAVSRC